MLTDVQSYHCLVKMVQVIDIHQPKGTEGSDLKQLWRLVT